MVLSYLQSANTAGWDKIRLNADGSLRCNLILISFKSLNWTIEEYSIIQPTYLETFIEAEKDRFLLSHSTSSTL